MSTMRPMTTDPATIMTRPIDERDQPGGVREQRPHVVRVDDRDREQQADGQQRDDPAREASLGGQRADEAPQLLPLADALGDAVEHLGCVSSGLALHRRDERDLLQVAALHALDDAVERVLERDAELLVGDDALELRLATARGRRRRRRRRRRRGCVPRAGPRRARRGCPASWSPNSRRLRAIRPRGSARARRAARARREQREDRRPTMASRSHAAKSVSDERADDDLDRRESGRRRTAARP